MKGLSLTVVLVLIALLISSSAYAEEKLAYVDLAKLFDGYSKTKEYDKVLEGKQKTYEKDRGKQLEEIKKFQEKLSLLSEEERESRRSELEKKITQLQEFDRSSTQDLRKQRDEKVQEIFQDIKQAIENYAKKQGITLIFDKRALVYENKDLDITVQVAKILK